MLALSDGVFAFAITLLVLDLVVPSLTVRDVVGELLGEWPQFLAHIISFATIGAAWLAHSAITDHMARSDSTFARLNLLVLLLVSFMPYPTRLLSIFIASDTRERIAVTLYGASGLLLIGLLWLLWAYARREGLFDAEVSGDELALFTGRMLPGMACYAALIIVGWFLPMVAVIGYAVIALYFIIPFRLRRLHRQQRLQ
ncbi:MULTISPECIES: TMEM175 family protein [unclassified Microbacterium]|uniref:TMEM175 family protein n=1 Tax=unclassified Microbacterium TaxID=2609290 RepID=UPI00364CB0CE